MVHDNNTNLYRNSGVIFNAGLLRLFVFIHIVLKGRYFRIYCHERAKKSPGTYLVNFSLDNQPPAASGNKFFEHFLEVFRYLFEGPFNRFILALIQHLDEFLNRLCRRVEVLSTLDKLISLLSEVIVLFKGLLVDMRKLLEAVVDSLQLLNQLHQAAP